MKPFPHSRRFVVAVLFSMSLLADHSTYGQATSAGTSREQLLTTAREIMATARYAALITTGANGRINARTMDPFPPAADMVIWFGTNPKSRKVRELRRDPRVTIYYIDPAAQAYVSFRGRPGSLTIAQRKLAAGRMNGRRSILIAKRVIC